MVARILLFDVMDTLVVDPFFRGFPEAIGVERETLFELKTPGAWEAFEVGAIDEATFAATYFRDGRPFDVERASLFLRENYAWIEGAEALLGELKTADVPMHVLSNYPVWYTHIEAKLSLSRYLPWSFVSWNTGVRKPDADAYLGPARTLGSDPADFLLVDDRAANCEAAVAVGMDAVRFTGVDELRLELAKRGILESA